MNQVTRSVAVGIVVLAASLFCAALPSLAEEEASSTRVRARYSGRLRTVYDFRSLDEMEDADLYGYWHVRGTGLLNGRLGFYTSGRLHQDLDDSSTSMADDPFVSLDDHDHGDDLDVRVLQAYGDLHDQQKRVWLRAGRQYIDVADFVHVDGAQLMLFERSRIGGRVFGGKPVSYYASVSGDLAAGGSLIVRPWKGSRMRATYAHYSDDSADDEDNHILVDVWQNWPDSVRTRARCSILNEEFRMGSLVMSYTSPEGVSDIVAGVHRWGDYDANTRIYSPLYAVLGDSPAYTYAHARLTQGLLPWLFLSPSVAYRLPDDDTSAHNREWGRYDVSLILEPSRTVNASLSVEYWDVEDGDQFVGASGEVRFRFGKRVEIKAGAAHADYEYSRASDLSFPLLGGALQLSADGTRVEYSPDVLTYFLRGRWNVVSHLWLDLRGEVEDSSEEEELSYRARGAVEVRF